MHETREIRIRQGTEKNKKEELRNLNLGNTSLICINCPDNDILRKLDQNNKVNSRKNGSIGHNVLSSGQHC